VWSSVLCVVLIVSFATMIVMPASASESSGAVAWGLNNDGQLGNGTSTSETEATAVRVLTEATAVAAGETQSFALLETGKVMAWGDNAWGQLGIGASTPIVEKEPVEVKGLSEVVAIAAGSNFSLALLESHKIKAWGLNFDGQLGVGSTTPLSEPEAVYVKGNHGSRGGRGGLGSQPRRLEKREGHGVGR
jgi:alpha-tubulin suppressor-like RCC1 family protein